VPLLSGNNSFNGNQAVTGNLSDTGNISASGSITGQTGTFSANSSGDVVSITQSGSGDGLYVTAAGNVYPAIEAGAPKVGIEGTAGTNGIGVEGFTNSGGTGVFGNTAGGTAVLGLDDITSGASVGVSGESLSSSGIGVQGASPNVGVSGSSSTSSGYGVYGKNTDGNSPDVGVGVYGTSASGSGFGVYGQNTSNFLGTGVGGNSFGSSQTGQGDGGPGVWGDAGNAGNTFGTTAVLGTADVGYAGFFVNNNPDGYAALTGQNNWIGASGVLGTLGIASCCSTEGRNVVDYNVGIWGDTAEAEGTASAVVGTADDNWAAHFYNNSATHTTLNAQNDTSTPGSLVFKTTGTLKGGGECTIDVEGVLNCSGTESVDVPVDGGARRVSLYAMEAPDNWFEDAGSGQLSNGSARIELDSTFAQTVNTGLEYHVFLTPKGDCKGLYVSNESATSFEVHELGGGTSSIAFDYRIMAKRVGYESVRLADVTERYRQSAEELAQQRQNQGKHPMPQRPMRRPASPGPIAPPRPPLPVRAAVRPLNTENK